MVGKPSISFFLFLLMTVSANAQFGSLNSQGSTPSVLQRQILTSSWEQIPPAVLACVEDRMQETTKMGIRELKAQNVRPSDPPMKTLIDQCAVQASRPSDLSAPRPPTAAEKVKGFVEWFNADVLVRQTFRSAFLQCKTIMSAYQNGLLNGLRAQIDASSSKQEQQQMSETLDALTQNQRVTLDVACVKVFVASLRIAGSQSGSVGDELSLLNGRLSDRSYDLLQLARARIDDLTDEGVARVATKMSLADLDRQGIKLEIATTSLRFPTAGYLSCLVTHEWVARFSTDAFCHKSLVENSLSSALNALPLPDK